MISTRKGKKVEVNVDIAVEAGIETEVGARLANEIANVITLTHRYADEPDAYETEKQTTQRLMHRQPARYNALQGASCKLGPPRKKAILYDSGMNLNNVKTHRGNDCNMEKRPSKSNSWVVNRPVGELQTDLLFFQKLK